MILKISNDTYLVERAPTAEEYGMLRYEVGWEEVESGPAARGLAGALYSVCLENGTGEILGCARVVGDGGIYFYLQDVIVREPFRGRGLGAVLMDAVMGYIARCAGRNSFVGLMAADGVAGFYRRYGFEGRPAGRPGMYQMWQRASDTRGTTK